MQEFRAPAVTPCRQATVLFLALAAGSCSPLTKARFSAASNAYPLQDDVVLEAVEVVLSHVAGMLRTPGEQLHGVRHKCLEQGGDTLFVAPPDVLSDREADRAAARIRAIVARAFSDMAWELAHKRIDSPGDGMAIRAEFLIEPKGVATGQVTVQWGHLAAFTYAFRLQRTGGRWTIEEFTLDSSA